MFRALCLTRRNKINYNIFTLPPPKIALLNVSEELKKFTETNDIFNVCKLSDLIKNSLVGYLVMENIIADNKYVQFAMLQGALVVEKKCK